MKKQLFLLMILSCGLLSPLISDASCYKCKSPFDDECVRVIMPEGPHIFHGVKEVLDECIE
jgi:hypothetical protein